MSDFMWRRHLSRVKGFYGVVCSALDIGMLSGADKKLKRVCPGIALPIRRAAPSGQVRITTPKEAKELGADYLVIGRAVTESKDPVKTIKDIIQTL
jgi:orotidine-5'-phosphate decarboxylase